MSNFLTTVSDRVGALNPGTSTRILDNGTVIAATPVIGGAAVVGSALIAYAVEEAGDN